MYDLSNLVGHFYFIFMICDLGSTFHTIVGTFFMYQQYLPLGIHVFLTLGDTVVSFLALVILVIVVRGSIFVWMDAIW